jgi:translation elongation factor EF-Tu-like GTPase
VPDRDSSFDRKPEEMSKAKFQRRKPHCNIDEGLRFAIREGRRTVRAGVVAKIK